MIAVAMPIGFADSAVGLERPGVDDVSGGVDADDLRAAKRAILLLDRELALQKLLVGVPRVGREDFGPLVLHRLPFADEPAEVFD